MHSERVMKLFGHCDQQKKVVRSSLFPKIDAKNIDREVQPKWSSFSGKMEVAKPFLCSKLSSKSC